MWPAVPLTSSPPGAAGALPAGGGAGAVVAKDVTSPESWFNAAVTAFNTGIEVFPASLVAGVFGFGRRGLFQAAVDGRAVPSTSR